VRVQICNDQKKVRVDVRSLRRFAQRLLKALGYQHSGVSILLTDDKTMSCLHARWLEDPTPTDVLSFSYKDEGNVPEILGDIAISVETCGRRVPHNPMAEIQRMLVHGLLHLVGFDHRSPSERRRMDKEARWLISVGLGEMVNRFKEDPWRG